MELFLHVLLFVFGAVIGSFLNVVIYRFHTGKTLGGRSRCTSCGAELRWYELIPVLSYLVQWAKCRHCTSMISPRYLFVEILTGIGFLLVWMWSQSDTGLFIFNTLLVSLLIVIAVYDMRHTIIPDEFVILAGCLTVLFLGYEYYLSQDLFPLALHLGGGVVTFLFLGGLWYVSKGRWIGLGDAKLALPLGVIIGLPLAFSMVIFAFWIGALISLSLLCVQRLLRRGKPALVFSGKHFTIKSEVPFAPFLILGFISVYYFHADIFDITFFVFTF